MQLLSQQQCFDLWDKYQMPENIRDHSKQVAKVAEAVGLHMKKQGMLIDMELVNRGALIHDLAKIIAVNANREREHGMMGSEIAIKENLGNKLSEIIRKHYMDTFNEQCTLEELIVNYADKRVTHDKIVTLEERFDYICKNYPEAIADIINHQHEYYNFEKKYRIDQIDLTEK